MTYSEKNVSNDFTLYLAVAGQNVSSFPYHACAAHLYGPDGTGKAPEWCSPDTEVIDGTGTEALYDGILGALAVIRERSIPASSITIVVYKAGHQLLPIFGTRTLQARRDGRYFKWKHKPTLVRIDNEAEALGITLGCRVVGCSVSEEYERLNAVADDADNRKQTFLDDIEAGTEGFTHRKARG